MKGSKHLTPKKGWALTAFILNLYFIPLILAIHSIISGSIPFWYDPARDLLSGVTNLTNPSLIGPPSGIPGIFYGPYWIWSLSLSTLISQDPRFSAFMIQLLPYYILIPFIGFRLSRWYSPIAISITGLFFLLNFSEYTTRLWNPYIAPLLFSVAVFVLTITPLSAVTRRQKMMMALAGFVSGLAMNYHISFGIGLVAGLNIFLLTHIVYRFKFPEKKSVEVKNYITGYMLFAAGIALSFAPFFLFELRNGFGQIRTLIATLSAPGAVVSQVGLSKIEIINQFFGSSGTLLFLPQPWGMIAGCGLVILSLIIYYRSSTKVSIIHKPMLIVLTVMSTVLAIYLLSKNPVWEYHFINVEIIFVFLLIYVLHYLKHFRLPFAVGALMIAIIHVNGFIQGLSATPYTVPDLRTKEHIVRTVMTDAKSVPYTVHIYNPSIYTYDYSYLFQWMADKKIPYDPGMVTTDTSIVYLIIEKTDALIRDDFIENRTPSSTFTTAYTWKIPDGTVIIKRALKFAHSRSSKTYAGVPSR